MSALNGWAQLPVLFRFEGYVARLRARVRGRKALLRVLTTEHLSDTDVRFFHAALGELIERRLLDEDDVAGLRRLLSRADQLPPSMAALARDVVDGEHTARPEPDEDVTRFAHERYPGEHVYFDDNDVVLAHDADPQAGLLACEGRSGGAPFVLHVAPEHAVQPSFVSRPRGRSH